MSSFAEKTSSRSDKVISDYRPAIQTKLYVDTPNTPNERDADQAADRVVNIWQNGSLNAPEGTSTPTPTRPLVQRRAASPEAGAIQASPEVAQQIQLAQGAGQPLPATLQPSLEAAFGMDFSGVRLHTDARADALNRELQARAFTTGQDIFFRQGECRPGTAEGVRLLGHELGHVGQQGKGVIRRQEADQEESQTRETPPVRTGAVSETARSRRRRSSGRTLEISSETFMPAPSGAPNTRRIIGVGEYVHFTTNRRAYWEMTEQSPRRRLTDEMFVAWEHPGVKQIIARTAGGDEHRLEMTVVSPSLRTRKIREMAVESEYPGGPIPGSVGILMQLEIQLTPVEVSFSNLFFHEEACPAEEIWGYFATHRELAVPHNPRPQIPGLILQEWIAVDRHNIIQARDHAGYRFLPQTRPTPFLPGGFSWRIPTTYQLNGNQYPMQQPVIQTYRIDPRPGHERPPFIGSITAWKGGQMVTRQYS